MPNIQCAHIVRRFHILSVSKNVLSFRTLVVMEIIRIASNAFDNVVTIVSTFVMEFPSESCMENVLIFALKHTYIYVLSHSYLCSLLNY